MGWGNEAPLVDLKRASRATRRLVEERDTLQEQLAELRTDLAVVTSERDTVILLRSETLTERNAARAEAEQLRNSLTIAKAERAGALTLRDEVFAGDVQRLSMAPARVKVELQHPMGGCYGPGSARYCDHLVVVGSPFAAQVAEPEAEVERLRRTVRHQERLTGAAWSDAKNAEAERDAAVARADAVEAREAALRERIESLPNLIRSWPFQVTKRGTGGHCWQPHVRADFALWVEQNFFAAVPSVPTEQTDTTCEHTVHEWWSSAANPAHRTSYGLTPGLRWEPCSVATPPAPSGDAVEPETPDLMAALRASLDAARRRREFTVNTPS